MSRLMNELTDIIRDIPADDITRQRLILVRGQIHELIEENLAFKEQFESLADQALDKDNTELIDVFIECNGALFRKDPQGVYSSKVYCPKCRSAAASPSDYSPYHCDKCGWDARFTRGSLDRVLNKLP